MRDMPWSEILDILDKVRDAFGHSEMSSVDKPRDHPGALFVIGGADMPRAPKRCGKHGCTNRVTAVTYCAEHQPQWTTPPRPPGWATRRNQQLAAHPHCQCVGCIRCSPRGCHRDATQADHTTPLSQGGPDNTKNLQSLCDPCHTIKTTREALQGRGIDPGDWGKPPPPGVGSAP